MLTVRIINGRCRPPFCLIVILVMNGNEFARMPHTNPHEPSRWLIYRLLLPVRVHFVSVFVHFFWIFVRHPFGCMQIKLKYMEIAVYDKDSPFAKCKGSPINFLYDYYGYARMGIQIIANGTIHWAYECFDTIWRTQWSVSNKFVPILSLKLKLPVSYLPLYFNLKHFHFD